MPGLSIDGVISGLNTVEIIDQLVAIERRSIRVLEDRRALLDAKQALVAEVQAQVVSLQSIAAQLTLRNTVGAKLVTTDTPTTEPAVIVARASSDAANGSFKVTVKQIATATRVTSSSPDGITASAIGQAVTLTAPLASAGFGTAPTTGTFSINGVQITIDADDKLYDPGDTANSVVHKINAAGAGVTATVENDAYGRPNLLKLVSDAGRAIQLGTSTDTSNFLSAVGLKSGAVVGSTAATVTGGSIAAGAIAATITVNGKQVAIDQTDPGFTAAQNAAYIRDQLNAAGLDVTASVTGAGSDQIQLVHNTKGSQQTITLEIAGADAAKTGLTNGTTQNGADQIVTPSPLGRINPGNALEDNAFATALVPDANGGGTIKINGVEIAWKANESLNTILSRINASGAGVRATYDALTDRVTLSAVQTGGTAIALEDVSGNLLQSLHLLKDATNSVPQQLGQNAIVNIEGVNNGEDIVTSSNTLNGYLPGVTLELKRAGDTPVTVSVGQDTAAAAGMVRSFVEAVNALLDKIASATNSDPDPLKAGLLSGDSGILGIERSLRSLLSRAATGVTSQYQSLSDIGISTGAIGSAVGTTSRYQLDESKLAAALQDNPAAVETLFAGLLANLGGVTRTSGTGDAIVDARGTPTEHHLDGTYVVTVLDTSGNAEVAFRTSDGRTLYQRSAVLTANGTNTTLIPGVTLETGSTIEPGTFEFTVGWSPKGIMVEVNDYLKSLDSVGGFFDNRADSTESLQRQLDKTIERYKDRLDRRRATLERQFAQLEAILAQIQFQSSQVSSQILSMQSQNGSRR